MNKETALEERSARRAALEASLRDVMFQIVKFVNEKKDHLPSIPICEGVISYPYEITIPRWLFLLSPHLNALFVSLLIFALNFIQR